MNFSDRMKKIRESAGLTQKEFGDRLGLSQVNIKDIEIGRKKITPEIALEIEKEFGVNFKWLLTGDESGLVATGNGFIQGHHVEAEEIHINFHNDKAHEKHEHYSDPVQEMFIKDWLKLNDVDRLRAWTVIREMLARESERKEE